MTQTWTQKHLHFCITKRLTPTAIKLYQWLLGEMREGYAEIIDLHDFQRLVAQKRGKAHDFRIVQTAVERLISAGILRGAKKFTAFVWKWTIRPINRLIYPVVPNPKISEKRSLIPNLQVSKDVDASEGIQAAAAINLLRILPEKLTSDLEQSIELLEKADINFDAADVPEILAWENPLDVNQAIALFEKRGGHSQIENPEGWIRRCLQWRWWEDKKLTFGDALLNLAKSLGVQND